MRPSLKDIETAVCARFNLTPEVLSCKSRKRCIARPRQIAMFLARELTANSYPQIGRFFGNRNHATVILAVRRIDDLIARKPILAQYVVDCRDLVQPQSFASIRDMASQPMVEAAP